MKGFLKRLSPFAPDNSGVVSALFEFGGLIAVCDAGGCTGNVCGFDEPRWFTMHSAVFSTGMRDMDAILGRDHLLVDKIVSAQETVKAPFAVLVGTPVPAVIATDFKALRRMAEKRTQVPVLTIESTGVNYYDKGASKAFEMLFDTFAVENLPVEKDSVGILGATPLDFSSCQAGKFLADSIDKKAYVYGMGAGLEAVKHASANERNIAVSPSGVAAARLLEKRFGTPWQMASPWLPEELLKNCSSLSGKKVLIIHQQFAAAALREKLLAAGADDVACATFFMTEKFLTAPHDRTLKEEEDLAKAVEEFKADVVIGDRMFKKVLPDFKGGFIDFPHFAVSGRLWENL